MTVFPEAIRPLIEALVVTLDALEQHELNRPRKQDLKIYKIDELGEACDRGDFFAEDPIGYGLRKAIRKAGELIGSNSNAKMMEEVADFAAQKDGKWSRWRSIIIDKNWDSLTDKQGSLLWVA